MRFGLDEAGVFNDNTETKTLSDDNSPIKLHYYKLQTIVNSRQQIIVNWYLPKLLISTQSHELPLPTTIYPRI